MIGTLTAYRQIANDPERSLKTIASNKMVQRETAYFESKIGNVKSIDDFMSDRRHYGYVLRAFGMGELTESRALIRKVLEGGIDDSKSLANSLADPRFRDLAETFNFARYSTATTSFSRTQSGVVERYMQSTLEETAGRSNEGVRLALYFQRKAPSITSIYQILGDKALYRVAEVALSLPPSLPAIGVEKQAAYIANRLDVGDLKDGGKLDKFLSRFANMWDLAQSNANASPAVQLMQSASGVGISTDTLASIQSLQINRR